MSKAKETSGLLSADTELGPILYEADFGMENTFMTYQRWSFIGMWLFLTLSSCGILLPAIFWFGCAMFAAREGYRNRRLYVTPDYVVLKTRKPSAFFPCWGMATSEKHIMLSLITDVVVSQSWFQSCFGIEVVKIENPGQAGVGSDGKPQADMAVDAIVNAKEFKRAVLAAGLARRQGQMITGDFITQAIAANSYTEVVGQPTSYQGGTSSSVYPQAAPVAHQPVAPVMAAGVASDNAEIKESLKEMNQTLRQVAELLAAQAQK